jgi:carbon-monoxide dehydrogenase large subunit
LIVVDYEAAARGGRYRATPPIPASRRCGTNVPANLCFDWELGDENAAAEAQERRAHREVADHRQQPRRRQLDGAARRDRRIRSGRGRYTLWSSTQGSHFRPQSAGRACLQIPENRIRVVTPDVAAASA